jgi:predicted metallopeptidase
MAKNNDYVVSGEISDAMENMIDAFPALFEGFDVNRVLCVMSRRKKSKDPVKLINIGYPREILSDKVYIIEVFFETWKTMSQKKKNLALFHAMCGVPPGGFDETNKNYGKKRRPDYAMYLEEFAVSGGVPNWMENDAARDPLKLAEEMKEADDDQCVLRNPVTIGDIANLKV